MEMIQSRFHDGSVLLMNEVGTIRYNQQYIRLDGGRRGKHRWKEIRQISLIF